MEMLEDYLSLGRGKYLYLRAFHVHEGLAFYVIRFRIGNRMLTANEYRSYLITGTVPEDSRRIYAEAA